MRKNKDGDKVASGRRGRADKWTQTGTMGNCFCKTCKSKWDKIFFRRKVRRKAKILVYKEVKK